MKMVRFCVAFVAMVFGFPAMALELGAPFTDGAVLQRDMAVPVWGWTAPGGAVTVAFGDQKKTAKAGDDGKWMVSLDPLKASFEAAELKVSDDKGGAATVKDVLVGEVWLASGQSNMQWPVGKCDGQVLLKGIADRVAAGKEKQPVIREGKVTNRFAVLHPIEHAQFAWSTNAEEFSAVSFAFAYALFKELDVPIGILNCSFSQTAIQAWTPRVGLETGTSDYTKNLLRRMLETDPSTLEHAAAWKAFYDEIETTLAANAEAVKAGKPAKPINTKTPGNLADNRDSGWLFNARISPVAPYAIRGCIWNQGYANMGEGLPYYDNLHAMIRGWRLVWNRPDLPVYFHQFYTPGNADPTPGTDKPGFEPVSEMRLGTWMARDIPHTGMACQIDIGGAIHYFNKSLPGMRLALHALKNQYGKKDRVTDGPMYKDYTVEGGKVIVTFEHAEGGLVVAETLSNSKDALAVPKVVPEGAQSLDIFFIADENRVWHPAKVEIDGSRVILTSPKVKSPHGVSYGSSGIGFQPNLYNKSLLPMTPFIVYDHKLVTQKDWPDTELKVDGMVPDPSRGGLLAEYRKLPILASQFRDGAVLQAGEPVVIWGACRDPWTGKVADGKAVIHFRFGDITKTVPATPDMSEWRVTLPPMEASCDSKVLEVSLTIDGELAHKQAYKDIVIGDVWYVGASMADLKIDAGEPDPNVRMMTRKAKRDGFNRPSRFSVSVSTAADNRFGSVWEPAKGFAGVLGKKIAAKTPGKPVGVVFMQIVGGKDVVEPSLAGWIKGPDLAAAPSLEADYAQLMSLEPGTKYHEAEVRRYVAAWKKYWGEYVPAIIRTKDVPDDAAWGSYPTFGSAVSTKASENYNVLVDSFTPGSFKGIVFLAGPGSVKDGGQHFTEQMTALANGWKKRFGCEDPFFCYTLPSRSLAPKITAPQGITGKSQAIELTAWPSPDKQATQENADVLRGIIDAIMAAAY